MRLHDRYLFRELLAPLAFCLGGFLVFWISYFFFTQLDEMQEHKLRLLDGVEYAVAMMPGFFVMVLPIALLLALLYALTQHARHQELTALRAAGVSLWRLCGPYFVVGLAASGLYFFLNEVAVPRSADWAAEILSRHTATAGKAEESSGTAPVPGKNRKAARKAVRFTQAGFAIHPDRVWQVGEYNADTKTMVNPNVIWVLPDGSRRVIQAARAEYVNQVWTFFNAHLFKQADAGSGLTPDVATNVLAMPEFDETPRQILSDIKMGDKQMLRNSRSADIPLRELNEYLKLHPHLPADFAGALRTKFHGRLAAPWTCLVVVLMAIPFGAPSGRRNLFSGVAGAIFICFAFFVLQQVSLALGLSGHLPPWLAAWLPNLFFAALGVGLIWRTR